MRFKTLQIELADKLKTFGLYRRPILCSSGAEANENALKWRLFIRINQELSSQCFHGRTSAAVATTDNKKFALIAANSQFLPLNDDLVEAELKKGDVACVIIEPIQGVGGPRSGHD
jgi:acetylornithine aminotransferase